jgi:hypothetical protein
VHNRACAIGKGPWLSPGISHFGSLYVVRSYNCFCLLSG